MQGNLPQNDWFVQLLGVSMDNKFIYLAEQYMENGDLRQYLDFSWSEGDVRIVARGLFQALKLMHQDNRMHLDIKPAVNKAFFHAHELKEC